MTTASKQQQLHIKIGYFVNFFSSSSSYHQKPFPRKFSLLSSVPGSQVQIASSDITTQIYWLNSSRYKKARDKHKKLRSIAPIVHLEVEISGLISFWAELRQLTENADRFSIEHQQSLAS
jgi:hypothetical protein